MGWGKGAHRNGNEEGYTDHDLTLIEWDPTQSIV